MEEIINYVMKTPENTNGNILREKLQKMSGSGGGELFEVIFSHEGEDGETVVCNRTQQEIVQAHNDGKNVKAFAILNGDTKAELLAVYTLDMGSGDAIRFSACCFEVTSFDVSQTWYVFNRNGIGVLVSKRNFSLVNN